MYKILNHKTLCNYPKREEEEEAFEKKRTGVLWEEGRGRDILSVAVGV